MQYYLYFPIFLPCTSTFVFYLFICLIHAQNEQLANTSCTSLEPPTCLDEGRAANGCLALVDHIHDDVDTTVEYYWGRHFERLGESADCVIVVLMEPLPRVTPAFVLLDYLDIIRNLYLECIVSGSQRGGYVNIGPHDRIPILIRNPNDDGDDLALIEDMNIPACGPTNSTVGVAPLDME